MFKKLVGPCLTIAFLTLLLETAAEAHGGELFPDEIPAQPSDLYPIGPDFPAGPDLGDFPSHPSAGGSMVCTSIHLPSGLTFTATGRKWTAASRALADCKDWQAVYDTDGLGSCSILNCEALIIEI